MSNLRDVAIESLAKTSRILAAYKLNLLNKEDIDSILSDNSENEKMIEIISGINKQLKTINGAKQHE